MIRNKHGSIPEKVAYLSAGSKKISVQVWDDETDETTWEVHEACPAFISDPDNVKTMTTGRNWANNFNRWDRQQVSKQANIELVVTNDPITDVRILSLERRSQGGRAYKVVIRVSDNDFYVDLREDVLVDTMKATGIRAGAILNGTFVWGKDGSQMKLIRTGSSLHADLVAVTKQSAKSSLSLLSLVPGRIYASKTLTSLYCGKMSDKILEMPRETYSCYREKDSLNTLKVVETPATHYWVDFETVEYVNDECVIFSPERLNSLKMSDIVKRPGECVKSRKVTDDIGHVVDFDQRELVKLIRQVAMESVEERKNYLADYFKKQGQRPPFPATRIGHGTDSRYKNDLFVDNVELRTYVWNSRGQYVQPAQGEPVDVDPVYQELLTYTSKE